MRSLILSLVTVTASISATASLALAQTEGTISLGQAVNVAIVGSGSYVCAAEDSFNEVPVLGRGESPREAEVVAIQECGLTGKSGTTFCKIISCERDVLNGKNTSVVFDITRTAGRVNIGFAGKTKAACYAKGWDSQYVAKAPTQTEALAMAKKVCAEDEGIRRQSAPNGTFCNVNASDCELQQGVVGNIGVDKVIGIFKRKKK